MPDAISQGLAARGRALHSGCRPLTTGCDTWLQLNPAVAAAASDPPPAGARLLGALLRQSDRYGFLAQP